MTWEADICRIEEASARTSQGAIGLGSWARARNGGGTSLTQSCNYMFLNLNQAVIGCLKPKSSNVRVVVCISFAFLFIVFEIYHIMHAATPL